MIENKKKLEGAILGVSQCNLASILKRINPKPIIVKFGEGNYYLDSEIIKNNKNEKII